MYIISSTWHRKKAFIWIWVKCLNWHFARILYTRAAPRLVLASSQSLLSGQVAHARRVQLQGHSQPCLPSICLVFLRATCVQHSWELSPVSLGEDSQLPPGTASSSPTELAHGGTVVLPVLNRHLVCFQRHASSDGIFIEHFQTSVCAFMGVLDKRKKEALLSLFLTQ